MLDRIAAILASSGTEAPRMRPTALYNEGWMLRLLLDWAEAHAKRDHPLHFDPGARWFSEGLLPSHFKPRSRPDSSGETWTAADGVIGHILIGRVGKADVGLDPTGTQLVAIEAKIQSGLSAGVKHAPGFNQAARTVACIAELLSRAKREPAQMTRLAFYIIAPAEQIRRRTFDRHVDRTEILSAVEARAVTYGSKGDGWLTAWFKPTLQAVSISLLEWEPLVSKAGTDYVAFYEQCLRYNRPRSVQPK